MLINNIKKNMIDYRGVLQGSLTYLAVISRVLSVRKAPTYTVGLFHQGSMCRQLDSLLVDGILTLDSLYIHTTGMDLYIQTVE